MKDKIMTIKMIEGKILSTRIAGIIKRGKAFDKDVHEVAVQALLHAMPAQLGGHGNRTFLEKLLNGMPKSARANALSYWATHFAPLNSDKSKENGFKVTYKGQGRKATEDYTPPYLAAANWNIEAAAETPFYDLRKDAEQHQFTAEDFARRVYSVLAKAEKELAESPEVMAAVAVIKGAVAAPAKKTKAA